MKHHVWLLATALSFAACQHSGNESGSKTTDGITTNTGGDTVVTSAPAEQAAPATTVSELVFMKNLAGKYPASVELFKNEALAKRLQTLLGDEYATFSKNWNVETPIIVEEEVVATSGCKQHACPDDDYLLYADLKNDNINVYNLRKGKLKVYAEKGNITLPAHMEKELATTKSNAAVK
ncbi:hypothetical protein KTO58_02720 [Chitinophaga pendula]|uniref:hypothetical protein n=1 Tax=Chitinophaga TaxID=79328 RepID=UPI000BAECBA2|nr:MULTISPECIES: hypothetical protein [Chitinophaga]ASZ14244.1 hypothetical protein CK934_26500 [Chitinophaga sp. MD30]UCJ08112.1 hypothetical protein KTO58_02720 [Chitinophaga pendula]